jgi:tyrosyl-tRNA synthetase
MSKSIPSESIFVHDPPEIVKSKIEKAFCPPKQVEFNPVLEIVKYAVFPAVKTFHLIRSEKYGGEKDYENYETLEKDYLNGLIHPLDLKVSVSQALIEILKGVRERFKKNPAPLKAVLNLEITR